MKYEKMIPPGTFCTLFGLEDLVGGIKGKRFLEIGCGEGMYSKYVLDAGAEGVSIDFSERALNYAKINLSSFIASGKSLVLNFNFLTDDLSSLGQFDFIYSIMVLEHIEDEDLFLSRIEKLLKPNGVGIIIVPSRPEKWGVEDDLVGHLRRYTKGSLKSVCNKNNFKVEKLISIGVPFVNLLLGASNFLVGKYDSGKKEIAVSDQTKLSGTREIPFKTIFPSFFKIILNKFTMFPLKVVQRIFYSSDRGLILGARIKKA